MNSIWVFIADCLIVTVNLTVSLIHKQPWARICVFKNPHNSEYSKLFCEITGAKFEYYYNNENGLWYELQGEYYIPCLTLGEEDTRPIGKWGRKHLRYIKDYRPVLYTVLLLGGKLSSHLAEIDTRATEMYELLMKQLAEKEGITEQLKAKDPMAWVGTMNNIRAAAEEIVNDEVIFAW